MERLEQKDGFTLAHSSALCPSASQRAGACQSHGAADQHLGGDNSAPEAQAGTAAKV